jgi:membrane dipeptidase
MSSYLSKIDETWQQGLEVLQPTATQLERGLELHRNLPVCENYGFLPKVYTPQLKDAIEALNARNLAWPEWKRKSRTFRVVTPLDNPEATQEFEAVLNRAGVAAMIQSVNYMGESLDDAMMIMAAYRRLCLEMPRRVFQATQAEDITEAKKTGRTAIFFSLTGLPTAGAGSMGDLDGLLDWVQVWYNMGVRFMHLGYNRRNAFADGCLEVHDGGLSDLGSELIARMNRAGIIVDVPHSSKNSTLQAAQVSSKPITASHIGCVEVNDHPRCKTDEEIKAIAATGGYVGIFGVPGFLGGTSNINMVLRHVEHAVKVVGAGHVAIGTDLGYGQDWPKEIEGQKSLARVNPMGKNQRPSKPAASIDPVQQALGRASLAWTNWPLLTVGLVKMGLKDDEIEKILGGNLQRLLRDNQPG